MPPPTLPLVLQGCQHGVTSARSCADNPATPSRSSIIRRERGEGRAGTDARTSGYRGATRMVDLGAAATTGHGAPCHAVDLGRPRQASTQIRRRQGLHPVEPPDLASGSTITGPRQHHARSAEGHAECLLPRAG